ncbi:MAG: hypothetical protein AAFP77_27035 [Bacteroidota bacterium]
MKTIVFSVLSFFVLTAALAQGENEDPSFGTSTDLIISGTSVVYDGRLEQLIFSIEVEGVAGQALPTAAGQLDGASVLGYVFPTTLQPTDVGGTGY